MLRLARELAGEGAGHGQPRNSNLRRAVSSAYYAVFHAIALAVAEKALPSGSEAERQGYARYVAHGAIKQACGWIAGNAPPRHLESVVFRLRANRRLSLVAAAFVALQEQREMADYDHVADFTRPAALASVDRADVAVTTTRALSADGDFADFCGLVALRIAIR